MNHADAPLVVAVVALALLLGLAAWLASLAVEELRAIRRQLGLAEARRSEDSLALAQERSRLEAQIRGLRQQMANMLGMLLRAGFKRAPARDWSDDEDVTQSLGEGTETKWDWRVPVSEEEFQREAR